MKDQCNVIVIDSFQELVGIGPIWNELVMQSSANTIFLTWEWLYTWSKYFLDSNRKLFILAVYEKEKLMGLAPWCIRTVGRNYLRIRQIEFLGTPETSSDYLDVFTKKGKEEEVTHHIYNFLFGEGSNLWDSLLLRDIPSDSLFLLYFMEQVRRAGKYAAIREGSFCPIVALPRSWENFVNGLSSNRRKNYRYELRLLKRYQKVKHDTIIQGSADESNLDRFLSLYRPRWGKHMDERFYSHLNEFAERCVYRSSIQTDFLSVNGRDIAAFLSFRYEGTLFLYLMAVDKDFDKKISIGNILVGLCLEKAISEGITVYDFLQGSEDYKFHWTGIGRRSLVLNLYQRRLGALGIAGAKMLKETARIFLR